MNRKKKYSLKLTAIILSICVNMMSVSPCQAEASWFSDLCGGLFTFITAPIWVFCPDNPTFRKNNPFKKKKWEEEERLRVAREEALKNRLKAKEEIEYIRSL